MQWDADIDDTEEYMGAMTEDQILDEMIDEAELMGCSVDDPVFMGGFLRRLAKRIGNRVRARRARKRGGSAPSAAETQMKSAIAALQTPDTTAMVPAGGGAMVPAGGGAAAMMKNPMVLGGLAVAALLAMKMMKKKK